MTVGLEVIASSVMTVAANAVFVGKAIGRHGEQMKRALDDISIIKRALGLENGHAEPGRFVPREACKLMHDAVDRRHQELSDRIERLESLT